MTETMKGLSDVWKNLFRKHWKMILVIIGVGIGAAIGGILVFLWVVENGQATGLFPMLLGEWTVGYCITFILHVILWELLFIVIPVAVVAIVIYMQWYRKLPEEEKLPHRGVTPGRGSGGFSFLVTIVWLIIVWLDGRWNIAFQSWTLNDWVYSWLAAFLWPSLIIGIPVAIGVTWWIRHELKGKASTSEAEEAQQGPS